MSNVKVSLKRTKSEEEGRCGVCDAAFVPLEDSGCRVLTLKSGEQEAVTALLCGGCHSKWAGGTTVTIAVAPLSRAMV